MFRLSLLLMLLVPTTTVDRRRSAGVLRQEQTAGRIREAVLNQTRCRRPLVAFSPKRGPPIRRNGTTGARGPRPGHTTGSVDDPASTRHRWVLERRPTCRATGLGGRRAVARTGASTANDRTRNRTEPGGQYTSLLLPQPGAHTTWRTGGVEFATLDLSRRTVPGHVTERSANPSSAARRRRLMLQFRKVSSIRRRYIAGDILLKGASGG